MVDETKLLHNTIIQVNELTTFIIEMDERVKHLEEELAWRKHDEEPSPLTLEAEEVSLMDEAEVPPTVTPTLEEV